MHLVFLLLLFAIHNLKKKIKRREKAYRNSIGLLFYIFFPFPLIFKVTSMFSPYFILNAFFWHVNLTSSYKEIYPSIRKLTARPLYRSVDTGMHAKEGLFFNAQNKRIKRCFRYDIKSLKWNSSRLFRKHYFCTATFSSFEWKKKTKNERKKK